MDLNILPELVQKSGALTQADKDRILNTLSEAPLEKKQQLYTILMDEQKEKNGIYHRMVADKKAYERKRARIIYRYFERKVTEEEVSIFAELDKELETL